VVKYVCEVGGKELVMATDNVSDWRKCCGNVGTCVFQAPMRADTFSTCVRHQYTCIHIHAPANMHA
jgi:hypothetical protein